MLPSLSLHRTAEFKWCRSSPENGNLSVKQQIPRTYPERNSVYPAKTEAAKVLSKSFRNWSEWKFIKVNHLDLLNSHNLWHQGPVSWEQFSGPWLRDLNWRIEKKQNNVQNYLEHIWWSNILVLGTLKMAGEERRNIWRETEQKYSQRERFSPTDPRSSAASKKKVIPRHIKIRQLKKAKKNNTSREGKKNRPRRKRMVTADWLLMRSSSDSEGKGMTPIVKHLKDRCNVAGFKGAFKAKTIFRHLEGFTHHSYYLPADQNLWDIGFHHFEYVILY